LKTSNNLDLKWRRKILRIRDSLYVSIPAIYAEASRLTPGQYMEIRIESDGSINVRKEMEIVA
jgi:antitoxin component of MazEF toxin-antitoxin module